MRNQTCNIGGFSLDFPFVLAPLAGITDGPFRRLCREQGAGLTYTEMVSAKGLYYQSKNTETLLSIHPEEGPVGIQLFGAEPELIGRAAGQLKDRSNVLLDINMGCPVPKVVRNAEGSALLNDPTRAAACVRAAVEHAGKPVTIKMRIGFAEEPYDYSGFAAGMEAAGCSAVAVHGRTREQYYSGKADWNSIARIKKMLKVPVIGNGDVFSAEEAIRMMETTGCDAVMIARGALGNPWIFRELRALWDGHSVPPKPSVEEIRQMLLRHLALTIEAKGEYAAVREMRKHVGWYIKGIPGAAQIRRIANSAATEAQLQEIIYRLGTSSSRLE